MAFDRTYFDPKYLDLFWCMIAERMRIYWRRKEGLAPPWTLDPILKTEFITNVYREADPGTRFLIDNILAADESPQDKLLNVFIYRLMGSRESTWSAIGFQRCDEVDAKTLRRALKAQDAPFGEAYRTASYVDMGSKDKVVNVSRLFARFGEDVPGLWEKIQAAENLEGVYKVLESVAGFGDFLAYQIMVDLLYPAPVDPLVPYTQNEWAKAGPGARRGAWKLLKPGMKPGTILEIMRWLHKNQDSEFARLGLEMLWMKDAQGNDVKISLCNIQSCLCEYYKYTRIWDGKLKYARKYTYSQPLDGVLDELPLTFGPDEHTTEATDRSVALEPLEGDTATYEPEFLPAVLDTTREDTAEIQLVVRSNKKISEVSIKFD